MIQLILGPMFSGKTTELLRRLRRAKIAGKKGEKWLREKVWKDTKSSFNEGNIRTG